MKENKTTREYKYPRGKGKGAALDLIGLRFNRLVVTGRAPDKIDSKTGKHRSQWYCDCDCGSKNKIILGASLTSGAIQSCGCLHKETSAYIGSTYNEHKRKTNVYDLSGNFGIGYTSKGEEFYFDLDDYEKIKDICWYMNRGYLVGYDTNNKINVRLHRLINEPSDWQVVDHINGLKNDNRKRNLRNVSQTDNTRNRAMPLNNTSGHIGVNQVKSGKWVAHIRFNNKQIHLGTFDTFIDAVDARTEAEEKYYGEYRRK